MLRLVYNDKTTTQIYDTNDIKDLRDIIIGHMPDEPLIGEKVINIASWMNWGDKFTSKNYTIINYDETKERIYETLNDGH
jgi:hypothetical protein